MIAHIPAHSLKSIRTLRGNSQQALPPHKAYLKVSFLELERARYGQEIRSGQARLEKMLDRCRQIEKEKVAILEAMHQRSAAIVATPAAVRSLRNGRRQFNVSY